MLLQTRRSTSFRLLLAAKKVSRETILDLDNDPFLGVVERAKPAAPFPAEELLVIVPNALPSLPQDPAVREDGSYEILPPSRRAALLPGACTRLGAEPPLQTLLAWLR